MNKACDICAKIINGKYVVINDTDTVCDACFSTFIKCDRCGRPLHRQGAIQYRRKLYCKECFESQLFCTNCEKVIKGEYYQYEKYSLCPSCDKLQKCVVCSLPWKSGRPIIKLYEDHFICRECKDNAVLDSESLKKLFQAALTLLNRLFGIKIKKLNQVKLVSKAEILRESRQLSLNDNRSTINIKGIASSSGSILILKGESKSMALEVIVHELGHIWQFENWPDYTTRAAVDKEGFCEWLAYKSLKALSFEEAAEKMLNNKDEIYGKGLRIFLEWEKTVPMNKLIKGSY